jgi:hypothetical protein
VLRNASGHFQFFDQKLADFESEKAMETSPAPLLLFIPIHRLGYSGLFP